MIRLTEFHMPLSDDYLEFLKTHLKSAGYLATCAAQGQNAANQLVLVYASDPPHPGLPAKFSGSLFFFFTLIPDL